MVAWQGHARRRCDTLVGEDGGLRQIRPAAVPIHPSIGIVPLRRIKKWGPRRWNHQAYRGLPGRLGGKTRVWILGTASLIRTGGRDALMYDVARRERDDQHQPHGRLGVLHKTTRKIGAMHGVCAARSILSCHLSLPAAGGCTRHAWVRDSPTTCRLCRSCRGKRMRRRAQKAPQGSLFLGRSTRQRSGAGQGRRQAY